MFRPKTRYVALPSPRAGVGEEIDRLTCPKCDTSLEPARLAAAQRVCYRCGYHFRLRASERIGMLLEPGSFNEHDRAITAHDVLGFKDSQPYSKRIEQSRTNTGVEEAVTWGEGALAGHELVIVCFDFAFMGGSMGAATGEKITNGIEHALHSRLPLLIVCASGGARMQEGMLSLMQMAKTSAAIGRLGAAGLPYISLLTDPTMGGVTASFATLADVILAEPGAMIGFAGARVIQSATYSSRHRPRRRGRHASNPCPDEREQWQRRQRDLAAGRASPSPRPALRARLYPRDLSEFLRAARRSGVRRRPCHHRRAGRVRSAHGHGHRPTERPNDSRTGDAQLRDGEPGGLSEGAALDPAGRAFWVPHPRLRRYLRGLSRGRRRGTRDCLGDRGEPGGAGPGARPDRDPRDRRGRQRRRARDWGRRSPVDDGALDL
ncbi:MAG: hypothetical protein E6I88_12660 [Chloroflexi bacterium]|nr:MAG: hypothetical protein E6I88_12660 [Chloroflexota bacterium]